MTGEWKQWIDIYWIDDFKSEYRFPGVYVIRLVDSDGSPIKIGRFLGINESGIIQIGRSNNVGGRLSDFYKSCEGVRFLHSEGNRLFLIRAVTQFQKAIYKESKIQFALRQLPTKMDVEYEEERLLKCYFIKFGELPPLNCQVEDIKFKWTNPDCTGIDLW